MKILFLASGLALALTSCSLLFETDSPAAVDGGIADDGPVFDDGGSSNALVLDTGFYFLDTTSGVLTGPNDQEFTLEHTLVTEMGNDGSTFQLRRVALDSLSINPAARLRAHGVFALEFDVAGEVNISGILDVSSYFGQPSVGPGSNNSDCPGPSELDAAVGSDRGGAGGAGGPLESSGGAGGPGLETKSTETVPAYTWQGALRGGCGGGRGAVRATDDEMDRARGGAGGGALRIVSDTSIELSSAAIRASGAGAEGGASGLHAGGGGGGSGGTLWLEAPIIILSNSTVRANGGGGGEGASACTAGKNGEDGAFPSLNTPATGGATPAETATCGKLTITDDVAGGDGGAGSTGKFGSPEDGSAAPNVFAGGGGGGGGAEGFVIISTPSLTVQGGGIEPPPRNVDGSARDDG